MTAHVYCPLTVRTVATIFRDMKTTTRASKTDTLTLTDGERAVTFAAGVDGLVTRTNSLSEDPVTLGADEAEEMKASLFIGGWRRARVAA